MFADLCAQAHKNVCCRGDTVVGGQARTALRSDVPQRILWASHSLRISFQVQQTSRSLCMALPVVLNLGVVLAGAGRSPRLESKKDRGGWLESEEENLCGLLGLSTNIRHILRLVQAPLLRD